MSQYHSYPYDRVTRPEDIDTDREDVDCLMDVAMEPVWEPSSIHRVAVKNKDENDSTDDRKTAM